MLGVRFVGVPHQRGEVSCLHRAPEAAGDIGDLDTLFGDLSVTDDGDEAVTAQSACAYPAAHRPGCFEPGPQPGGDQVIHEPRAATSCSAPTGSTHT